MTNIGKVDQIVLQLRAQLQRAAKGRSSSVAGKSGSNPGPLERLRAIDPGEHLGDQDLRRKFIRAVLTEELGEEVANQPEFERISNEVWSMIEADPELGAQLGTALAELRQS